MIKGQLVTYNGVSLWLDVNEGICPCCSEPSNGNGVLCGWCENYKCFHHSDKSVLDHT